MRSCNRLVTASSADIRSRSTGRPLRLPVARESISVPFRQPKIARRMASRKGTPKSIYFRALRESGTISATTESRSFLVKGPTENCSSCQTFWASSGLVFADAQRPRSGTCRRTIRCRRCRHAEVEDLSNNSDDRELTMLELDNARAAILATLRWHGKILRLKDEEGAWVQIGLALKCAIGADKAARPASDSNNSHRRDRYARTVGSKGTLATLIRDLQYFRGAEVNPGLPTVMSRRPKPSCRAPLMSGVSP
jgi:hypothetical protein